MNDVDNTRCLSLLAQYLKTSLNGYLECSDNAISASIKNLFLLFSRNRQQMLNQIKKFRDYRTFLDNDKNFEELSRQYFVNLKELLVRGGISPVVLEIRRREYALIESYKESLNNKLPFNLRLLLSNHLDFLEKDLGEIDKISI